MLLDEIHEFRGWMGNHAIRVLAALVVDSLNAESPDYLHTGVAISPTSTLFSA